MRYGASSSTLDRFPPARNNAEAKSGNWPGRIPPVTDTKMIVAWNSLMISGLARAYGVFREPLYWELAVGATEFIFTHQWKNGRLHRLNYEGETGVLAQSEDYAFLIKALLDLQTASPAETEWLNKAISVQQEFDNLFWSVEMGGYYNNSTDNSQDLIVKERSYIDNATPSANGVAVTNLIRLARLTENLEYLSQAEQTLQAFSSILKQSPQACPSLFTALDWYRYSISVRSKPDILERLIFQYFPTAVYRVDHQLADQVEGLVCQGLSCLEPARSLEKLQQQIKQATS